MLLRAPIACGTDLIAADSGTAPRAAAPTLCYHHRPLRSGLNASTKASTSRRCRESEMAAHAAATDGEVGTSMQTSEYLHPDVESILFSEEEIRAATKKLGRQLAIDYKDKKPLLLTTLAGAFMFTADLCREMVPYPDGLQIDFLRASSYGSGTVSSGNVELQMNLQIPLEGRHILLIEDLIDSGATLKALLERLALAKPASIKVATLLRKERPRTIAIEPDYNCLEFSDGFVVGYGIDVAERLRQLPYLAIAKPSAADP